ncbi:MAG: dipeptidyl aminopeptidase/acylaminoacyl peptidase [Arenicella sp.]|jgi:dipeptidyl aminopeptidase/acylaminoacyl peptidase
MRTLVLFTTLLFITTFANKSFAQKKKIDYTTYDEWNHIDGAQQSRTGAIISYEINPLEGDSKLYIETKGQQKSFARGKSALFSDDESFVAFTIKPQFDSIRQMKLDKIKKIKFPKDTLAIYWPSNDSIKKIANVSSFKVSEKNNWVAYLHTKDLRPKLSTKQLKKLKKKKRIPPKTSGKTLIVLHPKTGEKIKIHRVKEFIFNRTGTMLAYTSSNKGDKDSIEVHVLTLDGLNRKAISSKKLDQQKLKFDYAGQQLTFLSSNDTGKTKNYSLHFWNGKSKSSEIVVDSITSGMPKDWTVSKFSAPSFSRDGSRIFFGTNKILREAAEETLLETEKAKVDVWGGDDLKIQPEQLKSLKRDKMKSYKAVYHLGSKKFVQLAQEELESVRTMNFNNADFAIGVDSRNHRRERNWAFPWKSDYYKVNVETGASTIIKKGLLHGGSLSPSGDYFVWYNGVDSSWMSSSVTTKKGEISLTEKINGNFASENNGMPFSAYPERANGWAKHNGEEYYVATTKYDIWFLNPEDPSKNFALTNQENNRSKIRYSLRRLERDSIYLTLENCLLKGVNDLSKDEGYYSIEEGANGIVVSELISSPHKFVFMIKAKESNQVLLRRQSFTAYPELEKTDITFKQTTVITDVNPQQKDYNWGTVELVDWQAYDSTSLRGLLYKPEDFDPTKKYPMIVYFYEDYTNNLHFHYAPKPTASIVYATEYVSNGYVIFIPDVEYEAGHPAKSAFNCIVSGTDYLTDKYDWIDTNKLGLQGQSWGGYQTAQLITMTDKYAAAMAGAPVSNMFSAYGGIRWGSGMSRMFQYERTQSRIGYTIWERPDLYIENSPLFGLPNVTTPVLIMHNDNDGAVPWYQGIEMYMGLRRLDKDVWMLNYNGDSHNLRKLPNKRDLSRRMRQFFDHYLLDEPMPSWMKNGVPAIDKGIESGFELDK